VVGFPWADEGDANAPLAPELVSFLDAGPPPVIMGLGSILPSAAGDVYRAALEACCALERRVLLIGANPEQLPALPKTALAVRSAPYCAVFPKGCATIHHAGIGTLAEALRAGRPSVVIPFTNDQPDNAQRAEKMGQGTVVARKHATTKQLERAIARCLGDEEMRSRATDIGRRLVAEPDGATRTARLLRERLAS
jgi:UDP:flavonoid glycosyltransferase YjiC (YdhE family)